MSFYYIWPSCKRNCTWQITIAFETLLFHISVLLIALSKISFKHFLRTRKSWLHCWTTQVALHSWNTIFRPSKFYIPFTRYFLWKIPCPFLFGKLSTSLKYYFFASIVVDLKNVFKQYLWDVSINNFKFNLYFSKVVYSTFLIFSHSFALRLI